MAVSSAAPAAAQISAQSLAIRSRRPRGHGGTDIARHVRQAEPGRSAPHGRGKTISRPARTVRLDRSDNERTWCVIATRLLRCISARCGIESQSAQEASLVLAYDPILIHASNVRPVPEQTMSGGPKILALSG